MNIVKTLEKIVCVLENRNINYALAGGLASNIYRKDMRLTQDIDFAVALGINEINIGKKALQEINLQVGVVHEGDLLGSPFRRSRKKTKAQILVGRNPKLKNQVGVDLILSTMPWVMEAITRAQKNKIKIFEKSYPALTIEDFVISKLYALGHQKRYKDLDDLEQVLGNNQNFDITYLAGRMDALNLPIPKDLRQKVEIDHELGRVAREIEKRLKKIRHFS